MSEDLSISKNMPKKAIYEELLPQIRSLVEVETDLVANLANIVAALKYGLDFFWVGFYLVKDNELVLGPFQGSVACSRIKYGKGVCGTAWASKEIKIVPNVDEFPGHIACSSLSKSEIVVPVLKNDEVVMVIDVDSDKLNDFDEVDKTFLKELADIVAEKL